MTIIVAMYIERIPNRNSPPAVLLRESYRDNGKVKKRTLANLSKLPPHVVSTIQKSLSPKSDKQNSVISDKSFVLGHALQYGQVEAILQTMDRLGLPRLIDRKDSRDRRTVLAMIADRIMHGGSKLSTSRQCNIETAISTLGKRMDLEDLTEYQCYQAMDWLLDKQKGIQKNLAKKHIENSDFMLYDMSSSYFEGKNCPIAKRGYSRDHRGDLPQVNYGLTCNRQGIPVAIEVFDGNTSDHNTFESAIKQARDVFGVEEVIFVGDRGMISSKAIDEHLRDAGGLHWITALPNASLRKIINQGPVQMTLFDDECMAEIPHPDHSDERLVICRNPLLAEERKRKRKELLDATERQLAKIKNRTTSRRARLKGKDAIGLAIGKVISKHKMQKHFDIEITEDGFSYSRNEKKISEEAALDGLYAVRTDINKEQMPDREVVWNYKLLSRVERAFRSMKSIDLKIRPIHHRLEKRVRAHMFICMLAYYVEWHMREKLAPILFQDEQSELQREGSVVKPAERSENAKFKASTKRTPNEGLAVMSYRDAINTLTSVVSIEVRLTDEFSIQKTSEPAPVAKVILDLLGVKV